MAKKPVSLWDRGWSWVSDSERKMKLIIGLVAFMSLFVGSVREGVVWAWRHFTGAEKALELDPVVAGLSELATRQDARIASNEALLNVQAAQVGEIVRLKEAEQQKAEATSKVYEEECSRGNLAADTCTRLGYEHPEQKR